MLYCSVTRSNHSFEPSSVPARSTHFLITFLNRHNSWLRLSLFFIPVALYRHKSIVHTRCILLYPQHSASSCVYYQRHTFQLGEPSISHPKENAKVIFRIREVKGSNPSRSTFSSSVILTLLLFFCMCIGHTLALGPRGIRTARPCRRQGKQPAQCNGDDRSQWLKQGGAVGAAF